MPYTQRLAYWRAFSVALGFAGNLLLQTTPWGLNVALWWLAVMVATWWLARNGASARDRESQLLWMGSLLFACLVTWRDAPMMKAMNGWIALVLGILAGATHWREHLRNAAMEVWVALGVSVAFLGVLLPVRFLILATVRFREPEAKAAKEMMAFVRGILVAMPILLGFLILFLSADATYESRFESVFDFLFSEFAQHVLRTLAFGWIAAVFMSTIAWGPPRNKRLEVSVPKTFGAIEVNTVMALVNLLFLSFVLVQLPYFFGGHERVLEEAGLTYADYARRGFLELALVSAGSLGLLLLADLVLREGAGRGHMVFRWLGRAHIVLVLVVVASAIHRMAIYIEAYGLTVLRLYVAAFIGWLAIVFLWAAWTIMSGARQRFPIGALVTALVIALGLQAVNPEGLAVRVNLARAADGAELDVEHLTTLGPDAAPALIAGLDSVEPADRREIVSRLQEIQKALDERPWMTNGYGASRARMALAAWDR